ncbi:MAG: murein biosynthesis integral membrane protein MurJ [Gammaproteobacteria bacterium]
MSRQFYQATLVVSMMTLISRVLGFVRDMLIARLFGAYAETDAFFIAFKIPNFFRRLFTEGAFAHAFVPELIEYERQGDEVATRNFIDKAGGTLGLLLMLISILGVLAAPLLVFLFAPGFVHGDGRYELSVQMLRLTMPYLFFIGSVAFAGCILNSRGRFAVSALTPALLNICMITAAVWIAPMLAQPITALAWSVLVAGAVQLLLQFPALAQLNLLPRLRSGLRDADIMHPLRRMGPAVIAVSVTQVNLLLDSFMASWLQAGSVSWLYYSDRLVEFPLGILGAALATAILPKLAKDYRDNDHAAFSKALDLGMQWVLLIGLPAALGLILLAGPILYTLFQYDEFTITDTGATACSLMGYALGLPGFMAIKVLSAGFGARKDLSTPVRYGFYALLANLTLNVLLMQPLGHTGLALATSLAAFVNAGLLFYRLVDEGVYRPAAGWDVFLFRLGTADALMSVLLYVYANLPEWSQLNFTERAADLLLLIAAGATVYAVVLVSTGLRLRHFKL